MRHLKLAAFVPGIPLYRQVQDRIEEWIRASNVPEKKGLQSKTFGLSDEIKRTDRGADIGARLKTPDGSSDFK